MHGFTEEQLEWADQLYEEQRLKELAAKQCAAAHAAAAHAAESPALPSAAWRDYILRFNILFHDYGYHDDEIVALIGPEPPRCREIDPDLEAECDLAETQFDASYRSQ